MTFWVRCPVLKKHLCSIYLDFLRNENEDLEFCRWVRLIWLILGLNWRYTIPKCITILKNDEYSVQLESSNPFSRIPVDQTTEKTTNKDTQIGTKGCSLNAYARSRYHMTIWVLKILPSESEANGTRPDTQYCLCRCWAMKDAKRWIWNSHTFSLDTF